MSDFLDMFDTSDGHKITVRVLDGNTIEIRKLTRDVEPIASMELTDAEVRWVLSAKPTEAQTAASWWVGEGLTIAPPDVDRTAEALNSALANLS